MGFEGFDLILMTFLPFTYRKYTVVPNWVWVVREKWHAGPHLNKEFGLDNGHGGVISGLKSLTIQRLDVWKINFVGQTWVLSAD